MDTRFLEFKFLIFVKKFQYIAFNVNILLRIILQTCLTILLSFDGEIFRKTLCLKKRNVHDKFKSMLAIYNVDKEKA